MRDARLHGPLNEARRLGSGGEGDGAILMPAERPVALRRLVEPAGEDGPRAGQEAAYQVGRRKKLFGQPGNRG